MLDARFQGFEPIDVTKISILLGPFAGIMCEIGNVIMMVLMEEQVYDDWLDFYNRTYMIWHEEEMI